MTVHRLRIASRLALSSALTLLLGLACNAFTGVPEYTYDAPETGLQPATPVTESEGAAGSAAAASEPDAAAPGACSPAEGNCPPQALAPPSDECTMDADCTGPGGRCVRDASGTPSCVHNCDLLSASAPRDGLLQCETGMRCTFVAEQPGAGHTECSMALASGVEATSCLTDSDCRADLSCFRGRCTQTCHATVTTCPEGQVCSALALRAGQEVGSCCRVPEGQACNLATDCGCGAGETCQADNTGQTRCRAIPASPVGPYARCEGHDECPSLHSCVGGVCKLRCNSVGDCGADGVACVAVVRGDGTPIDGYSVCRRGCDLLSPQQPAAGLRACGAQATCFYAAGNLTDCIEAGPATQSASCSSDAGCAPGFDCFFGECQRWCDPASGCGDGLACSAIFSAAGRQLGSCCQRPADTTCDWATDCGCGAGETCAFGAGDTTICRAVSATPLAPYAGCTLDTQCPVRHDCVGGNCMARCANSSHCDAGVVCIPLSDRENAGVCARGCDVVNPQAPASGFQRCAAGLACLFALGADGTPGTYCNTSGPVTVGDGCTTQFDCALGLGCVENVCQRFCDLALDDCPNGSACTPIDSPPPVVGGRNIGACLAN